jgi:hypothetical protein
MMADLTALQYLIQVHTYGAGRFWSVENPKKAASNSELRRWIDQKSLYINGRPVTCNEVLDYDFDSVILFPKNARRRVTLV